MTPRTRGGFTLVEVVVVIGIILFLVGLTLSVSVAVVERSEIQQTETVLQILDTAVKEWELTADRKLSWGDDGTPPGSVYDVHPDTHEVFIITEVLNVIARSSQVKQIIAQIDPDFVHTYEAGQYPPWIDTTDPNQTGQIDTRFEGSLTILDAWGAPIYATHPGSVDASSPAADPDGTISTTNEHKYGIARNRQICFVSAGPDGNFGSLDPSVPFYYDPEGAKDNIYSYPINKP